MPSRRAFLSATAALALAPHVARAQATRTVTVGKSDYQITSDAEWVHDASGAALSCDSDGKQADYIRITSTVIWPSIGSRPPALVQSLVAPPNGSISDTAGALAVSVQNGQNQGVAGVARTLDRHGDPGRGLVVGPGEDVDPGARGRRGARRRDAR